MRIAINGMGRIGRLLFKLLSGKDDHEVVAVNDLMAVENLLYLLKYDSISGAYERGLLFENGNFLVANRRIRVLNEPDPKKLPWNELKVDVVVECTGKFTSLHLADVHLKAGATKVILSTTGSADIPLIIRGVNDEVLSKNNPIISPGGCMTNCAAVVLSPLVKNFGVNAAQLNIIHSYTTRQSLQDEANKNFRRGRASAISIIPVDIDLAETLERLIPELNGKITTTSTRVPIPCGALADFYVDLNKGLSVDDINKYFESLSLNELKGVMGYNTDPIVSSDIIGNPHSCIFDSTLTSTVGSHVKISAWFDNEFGYTNRLVEIIDRLKTKSPHSK
jgi:glyceraldehyde 3-phosphate dehydrogenase